MLLLSARSPSTCHMDQGIREGHLSLVEIWSWNYTCCKEHLEEYLSIEVILRLDSCRSFLAGLHLHNIWTPATDPECKDHLKFPTITSLLCFLDWLETIILNFSTFKKPNLQPQSTWRYFPNPILHHISFEPLAWFDPTHHPSSSNKYLRQDLKSSTCHHTIFHFCKDVFCDLLKHDMLCF